MGEESLERCINQVFRPKLKLPEYMRNGGGDCTVCQPDKDGNGHCSRYHPIRVHIIEVKNYQGVDNIGQGLDNGRGI